MKQTINIKYNNKTIVIPKPFNECDFGKNPLEEISVANRFNGESVLLPRFAVAIYDVIMGSETLATGHDEQVGEPGHSFMWDTVRSGLDWFRKYFPKQYMVLLD